MKQLRSFLIGNKLLSLSLLAAALALGMELGGQPQTADWLLGIMAAGAAIALAWEMIDQLRHGHLSMHVLAITAIVAAIILGEYWTAVALVIVVTGSRILEAAGRHKISSELRMLAAKTAKIAQVVRKGKPQEVPADSLKLGDKIIVQANAIVPANAVVIEGAANFDESVLTGENIPQPKQTGSLLLSGSVNLDGPITAKVTADPEHSQQQQIARLTRSAASSQAPFGRLVGRYSAPFSLAVLALGGAAWALSGDAHRFLEVIVVASTFVLVSVVPLSLLGGITRAARHGIFFRSGTSLENLADTQTLAFDTTGTLTRAELSVRNVQAFGKFNKDEVLRLAASLAQSTSDGAAQAVRLDAQLKKIKLLKAKNVQSQPGLGVTAQLKGQTVIFGYSGLIKSAGIALSNTKEEQAKAWELAVYVAVDGRLAGRIILNDELSDNAKSCLDRLRNLGLANIVLLTASETSRANAIAKELDLSHAYGSLTPSAKLIKLGDLKPQPVTYVGKDNGDAPLLTAAETGIALGVNNSQAASDTADVMIMSDDFGRVATSYEISKRSLSVARQTLYLGVVLTLIFMGVSATGNLPALAGVGLQAAVNVAAVAYALRSHRLKPSDVH